MCRSSLCSRDTITRWQSANFLRQASWCSPRSHRTLHTANILFQGIRIRIPIESDNVMACMLCKLHNAVRAECSSCIRRTLQMPSVRQHINELVPIGSVASMEDGSRHCRHPGSCRFPKYLTETGIQCPSCAPQGWAHSSWLGPSVPVVQDGSNCRPVCTFVQ